MIATTEEELDEAAFENWRNEIADISASSTYRGGNVSALLLNAANRGESAVEPILYLSRSKNTQIRMTVCEELTALIISGQQLSGQALQAIAWTLEDLCSDNDAAIRNLARSALSECGKHDLPQIQNLFFLATATDRQTRSNAIRKLRPLACKAYADVCQVENGDAAPDCLGAFELPRLPVSIDRRVSVITYARSGDADLISRLLSKIYEEGLDETATITMIDLDGDSYCRRIAKDFGAETLQVRRRLPGAGHGILFSAAMAIRSDAYLCIDPRVCVQGALLKILLAMDAIDETSLMLSAVSENKAPAPYYEPGLSEILELDGGIHITANYRAWNPGLFAGHRAALLSLDRTVRQISPFIDRSTSGWEERLFSLAANTNDRLVPLNEQYHISG
jgi:hypothetical protein